MPSWSEAGRAILPPPWQNALIIAVTAAGFGLTLHVFYPGVMTYDARYVYEDIAKGFYGDWQSPAMTALWSLIDPIAPGPGSMFLLMATLYWLAFGILALAIARRSPWLALALPLLALSPPAFVFVGIIWRDVLFANTWLLAAALAFAAADQGGKVRVPVQIFALVLLAVGVLLRPNALLAAPILSAYILWPSGFSWRRTAIIYVPAAVALYALVHLVYYGVLGATRQHPLHSILVFDLGGITHFTKENQFPVAWSPAETDAAHRALLSANRVEHLLAASVSFRDGPARKRKNLRLAGTRRCMGARGRSQSNRLSPASCRLHVDIPCRREFHHVDLRTPRSLQTRVYRQFRLYGAQGDTRRAQTHTAVPRGRLVAVQCLGVRAGMASPRHAGGGVCLRRSAGRLPSI